MLGSSFDGRYPFIIGTSTVLIRCKNQFSKISKLDRVRHTKSAPKRRDELMRSLEIYFNERKKMYQNFERLNTVEIDDKIKREAMDFILKVSKEDRLEGKLSTRKLNQLEMLELAMNTEISDLGLTAWAIFNGATRYSTHTLTQKEKTFGNAFGNPAEINNRALQFTNELMS
jgi:hypothetical protein